MRYEVVGGGDDQWVEEHSTSALRYITNRAGLSTPFGSQNKNILLVPKGSGAGLLVLPGPAVRSTAARLYPVSGQAASPNCVTTQPMSEMVTANLSSRS